MERWIITFYDEHEDRVHVLNVSATKEVAVFGTVAEARTAWESCLANVLQGAVAVDVVRGYIEFL